MIYCKIEGCTGKHEGKGYCKKHYQRFLKYGDPLFTKFSKERAKNKNLKEKTYVKKAHKNAIAIDFIEVNGCFECNSHMYNGQRYGRIRINGRNLAVHRHIYEQMFGEIPKGYVILHTCDNTKCINPEHLKLGTQKDNVHDCVAKGRHRNKATKELYG